MYNDGAGRFPDAQRDDLPYPDFNGGWTLVRSIAAADLDGDGFLDLVLSHTRAQDETMGDVILTGRYLRS